MNLTQAQAIIFDFDGVLAESLDVKNAAFGALYAKFGHAVVDSVQRYDREHGGVSRFDKIRHFHRAFLGCVPTDEEVLKLAEEFSLLVEEAVVSSAWVPGARELLEAMTLAKKKLFIASGTPEDELQRIVARRGMAHFFLAVRGSPERKADIVSDLVRRFDLEAEATVLIGDAITDFEAARLNNVRFIGRAAPGRGVSFPGPVLVVESLSELIPT